MSTFRGDLNESLKDSKFALKFGAECAKTEMGATLAMARSKHGMSREELAKRSGLSRRKVRRVEYGEANLTLSEVGQYLAVLGLTLRVETGELGVT